MPPILTRGLMLHSLFVFQVHFNRNLNLISICSPVLLFSFLLFFCSPVILFFFLLFFCSPVLFFCSPALLHSTLFFQQFSWFEFLQYQQMVLLMFPLSQAAVRLVKCLLRVICIILIKQTEVNHMPGIKQGGAI